MAKLNKNQKAIIFKIRDLLNRIPSINNPSAQTEIVWCNKMFEKIRNSLDTLLIDFITYLDNPELEYNELIERLDWMNEDLDKLFDLYDDLRKKNNGLYEFKNTRK